MIITLFKPSDGGAIRYYTIHDRQPLLTDRYALTVAWRTGDGREREKIYGFDTLAAMDKKIRELFGRRQVVDRDELDLRIEKPCTEDHATDPTEPINRNAHHHLTPIILLLS